MGGVLGAKHDHSTSTKGESSPRTLGKIRKRITMKTLPEEGSNITSTSKASMDVERGGGGDHGEDNIMLGFQNLSISCDDPPEHIVANVSGFVVKGTGKQIYEKKHESHDLFGSWGFGNPQQST